MAQLIQAKEISLEELQINFGLQLTSQADFFCEWREGVHKLAETEKQALNRIGQNYLNLSSRRAFSEETVKMVVLSPLLDLAGFYQAPFGIQTEESVEITAEDDGLIVKGNIDVLVIRQQFWILVIESKSLRFDVLTALPQALIYMLNAPNPEKPVYGLLVNGREFVFVKLTHQPTPTYARSYALSLEREDELAQVLRTLRVIKQKSLEVDGP